jgi:hypothetical protein
MLPTFIIALRAALSKRNILPTKKAAKIAYLTCNPLSITALQTPASALARSGIVLEGIRVTIVKGFNHEPYLKHYTHSVGTPQKDSTADLSGFCRHVLSRTEAARLPSRQFYRQWSNC